MIDRRYGIEVLHDFPVDEDVGLRLGMVQAKFAHLARRFLALDDVDFVRQVEGVEPVEEQELRTGLSRIFGDRFRLTMVADSAVPQAGNYIWSGDDGCWDAVLGSIPRKVAG
ncbi:hypothetical protein BH09PSE3_BH09PSE3_22950 [soil metagenome]